MSDDAPISSVVRIVDVLREEIATVLGKIVKKAKHDHSGFLQINLAVTTQTSERQASGEEMRLIRGGEKAGSG